MDMMDGWAGSMGLGLVLSSIRKWNMTGRSLAAAVFVSTCASGLIVAGFFLFI